MKQKKAALNIGSLIIAGVLFNLRVSAQLPGKALPSPNAIADSLKVKIDSVIPAKPLLGAFIFRTAASQMNAGGFNFVAYQTFADISSPIYGSIKGKHPYFGQLNLKYQGLQLAGEKNIGQSVFHNFSMAIFHNYIRSKSNFITVIALGSVGSDFKRSIIASDLNLVLGVRVGWRQNKAFKIGVIFVYANVYSGQYLLPLPDFKWSINDHWTLSGLFPIKTSLKYKISNTQSLGGTFDLGGGAYRLNDFSANRKYIQLSQFSAGLVYDVAINRKFKMALFLEHAVMQKLQTFNSNEKAFLNQFNKKRTAEVSYIRTSFVLQAELRYLF